MTDLEQRRVLISQMIRGEDAMAPFMTNIDCTGYADFERYLAGQVRQAMDLRFDLEQKGDENGLLDWTLGKSAAFHEVLLTFRRVMALESLMQRPRYTLGELLSQPIFTSSEEDSD